MGSIVVSNIGKAYKQYPKRSSRLFEWMGFGKRHSLKWVLKNINFSVDAGETVGIIGSNGAGKSTLLKLITRTTKPSEGNIKISGRVAALLELGMGFHPDFTGRQNVFMAGQLLGYSSKEIEALMPEIEAFAEIDDYIDQPVRIYSSGMQMRLAFSVATAIRPDILIVDEALSVGDTHFQHKCFSRIRNFQSKGTTLLFVSHDVAAIRALCKKVVWLDKGALSEFGEVKEVLDAYAKAMYAKDQDISDRPESPNEKRNYPKNRRDCRLDFINNSNLRNDIEVFEFKKGSEKWGTNKARILNASFYDCNNSQLSWTIGGEEISLKIESEAFEDLSNVFVGFQVRDRLGQHLFGDNTYLFSLDEPIFVKKNMKFTTEFNFQMPILPKGTYSLTVAIASGNQKEHIIHEWINEFLFFESHNVSSINGLIGVPMHDIKITIK